MSSSPRTLRHTIPSLHGLLLFEAAARHLNFSAAAQELGIGQSAVSHGIRQLEEALGHPLFVRDSRTLSLTSPGQRLHAAVSGGFATISETVDQISRSDERETVVVSTSTVVATEWLLPRLADLREALPKLTLDIRSLDRDPDLAATGIDVHIRLGDGNWPGFEAVALWPETIIPVCSQDYRDRHGGAWAAADLLGHPLIHYVDIYRSRMSWADWFRAKGLPVPAKLPTVLLVNDFLSALRAAEEGIGVALGWRPMVDRALDEGRLVLAHAEPLLTGRRHYAVKMVTPGRRKLVNAFCDWLRESTEQKSFAPL